MTEHLKQHMEAEAKQPTKIKVKCAVAIKDPESASDQTESKPIKTASGGQRGAQPPVSYFGKSIEDTYRKKQLREHIYTAPDTYAGSIDPQEEEVWYYDEESERMVKAVNDHGGNARLTVYPEAQHDSWTVTYNNPELYEWFLKAQRAK